MSKLLQRRHLLQAGAALTVATVLPPARACEFFTANLRIFHPWTRATGAADSAVVCMKFDEVATADRLIGVESPVAAAAELVGEGIGPSIDLAIPAGQETELTESGTHVRLLGLRQPLMFARTYPMTLTFAKGGQLGVLLTVDFVRLG
jgi:copper(I)-binding protein